MHTPTPQERWERLRRNFLEGIDAIDDCTRWQENEPAWWLEMQKCRREVQAIINRA